MEGFWSKAIKATGSVGVVAFLLYTVLNYLFSAQIVTLFGSERMFFVTIGIIAVLLIILIITILKPKEKNEGLVQSGGPKVNYRDDSTHNGDNNF